MRVVRIAVTIVAVWATAAAITLFVGGATTLGPVVLEITKNHGIHLGDVVAGVVTAGIASVITALLVGVSIGVHLAHRDEFPPPRERSLTRL